MGRTGIRRVDLAKALAESSRIAGQRLSEGEAQDVLDRLVHGIVMSLRRGRSIEMPGVGVMTAQSPVEAKDTKPAARKKTPPASRNPKS